MTTKNPNTAIPKRTLTALDKIIKDLKEWQEYNGTEYSEIYEDCETPVFIKPDSIKVENGILYYDEETYSGNVVHNEEKVVYLESERYSDGDDIFCLEMGLEKPLISEYISDWRKWLRNAKRYWSLPTEVLDKMQDGEIEDIAEQ